MKKRRRRHAPPKIVPRLGPATNLRPAGAHESLKRYNRRKLKTALRQEIAEGGFSYEINSRSTRMLRGSIRCLLSPSLSGETPSANATSCGRWKVGRSVRPQRAAESA